MGGGNNTEQSFAAWRWEVEVYWFLGFALGITWAFEALWINLGPCQVVVGRV